MTGKDAILNYLKTHKTCSSPDVAAASGMTHTCITRLQISWQSRGC